MVIVALAYLAGRSLWNFIMKVWPKKVNADATGGWKIVRLVLRNLFGLSLYGLAFLSHPSLAIVAGILWVAVAVGGRAPAGGRFKRRNDTKASKANLYGM